MRSVLLAAAASVLALGPVMAPPVFAQGLISSPTTAGGYLQWATSASLFQIQSSQMALQVSRSPAIRSFAQSVIDDQTQMASELVDAAQRAGVLMPMQSLLPEHQQMLDRLRTVPEYEFDAFYRQAQLSTSQSALERHRTYATSGDAPMIQEVADRWWPCIQAHQEALPMVYVGERG